MSTETISKPASAGDNRLGARQWIDAFNARDDEGEASARTAGYTAHAPESMQLPALDSDAWVEFLGSFLKGFPDLHLEVQDAVADEGMTAQRILFTGTHTRPFRGLPPTDRKGRFSGIEINRMAGGTGSNTGRAHALRAARPARCPGPAIAATAHDRTPHEALDEVSALSWPSARLTPR